MAIEKTGNGLKAAQLVLGLILIVGVIVTFLGFVLQPFGLAGVLAFDWPLYVGVPLLIVGAIGWLTVRVMIWWRHR